MKVERPGLLPIKMWLDDIEEGAMQQAENLSNLPFAYRHVALMPDCHQGYGMPIGGVLATKDVVIPNAVGVDIGCGVTAMCLDENVPIKENLKEIMGIIRDAVPVGFKHHDDKVDESRMPNIDLNKDKFPICHAEYESARRQLGTLGGGNHFIELQKDNYRYFWAMIHSGSRNLGHKVASHYNKLAIELNKKWHSSIPEQWELAFLPGSTKEASDYLREMAYCVEFARLNRAAMIEKTFKAIEAVCGEFEVITTLDIAHNYVAMENHFGENVMVHRKGATRVRDGDTGIIPGSQGACSYIVKGLGNEQSFMSCSHGAGRKMGRKQAERTLDLEAEKKKMDDLGIIHSVRTSSDLDEAPGAYKDIDEVMNNQKDLVEIVTKLQPVAVIKG